MRPDKMIEGLEVLQSIQLDGFELIVAEDKDADKPYLLYTGASDNPFGIMEYRLNDAGSDYVAIMREFVRRIDAHLDSLDLDRIYRGSPLADFTLTAEHCVPGGMDQELTGKVIAVRAEVLAPEYRSRSHQMMICSGGFGAHPNARGSAVFCTEIYSGSQARWERPDILGVVSPEHIPAWAKEKLTALEKKQPERASVLAQIREAKAQPPAPRKPKQQNRSEPEL